MLSVETDPALLKTIIDGYETDPFCVKLANNGKSIDRVAWCHKLLYVGDRLVIPRVGTLREAYSASRMTHLGISGLTSCMHRSGIPIIGLTCKEICSRLTFLPAPSANETKAEQRNLPDPYILCPYLTNMVTPLP